MQEVAAMARTGRVAVTVLAAVTARSAAAAIVIAMDRSPTPNRATRRRASPFRLTSTTTSAINSGRRRRPTLAERLQSSRQSPATPARETASIEEQIGQQRRAGLD